MTTRKDECGNSRYNYYIRLGAPHLTKIGQLKTHSTAVIKMGSTKIQMFAEKVRSNLWRMRSDEEALPWKQKVKLEHNSTEGEH